MTTADFSSITAMLAINQAQNRGLGQDRRTIFTALAEGNRRSRPFAGLFADIGFLARLWGARMRLRDQVQALTQLDDRMLADIGLSRDELWSELVLLHQSALAAHRL